jgi:HSP20 family molecular chaperone IbpA
MTTRITPIVCAEYVEESDSYDVEIQLPGVEKKDIDLKVLPGGFMIRAPRANGDDTEYIGSYAFCCPVDDDKVDAKFENGLLKANFKLREPYDKATKVSID